MSQVENLCIVQDVMVEAEHLLLLVIHGCWRHVNKTAVNKNQVGSDTSWMVECRDDGWMLSPRFLRTSKLGLDWHDAIRPEEREREGNKNGVKFSLETPRSDWAFT